MKEDFFDTACKRFIDDSSMRENELLNNRANDALHNYNKSSLWFVKFAKIKCKRSSPDDNLTIAEDGI